MSRKNSNALKSPRRNRPSPAQGAGRPGRVAQGEGFAFALETKKHLGQHFLKDAGVIDRIAQEAQASLPVGAARTGVEIGPVSGALTKVLLAEGWRVTAIEKDERAADGLSEHLAKEHPETLRVVKEDILRWEPPTELAPGLCCGNLPYYITSDILFWFLTHAQRFTSALFMIQDEVASRLNARPGTKDFGRLSVRLQLSCEVEKVLFVPASAFVPPPKVNSAVVRLTPKPSPFTDAADERRFGEFTALLFSARRKMMRRVLASDLDALASPEAVATFWQKAAEFGVKEDTRPDAVSAEGILGLYRLARSRL
ncbi:MAG: ribosomal RNA small subunit methyltransferase A [Silvanigrellales bacterium]|nr:ribosomal RNA small subunit methyltransferase A [Silvanigrellales bacterium]